MSDSFRDAFLTGLDPGYQTDWPRGYPPSGNWRVDGIELHTGVAIGALTVGAGGTIGLLNPAVSLDDSMAGVRLAQVRFPSPAGSAISQVRLGRAYDDDCAAVQFSRFPDALGSPSATLFLPSYAGMVTLGDASELWIDELWLTYSRLGDTCTATLWRGDPSAGGVSLLAASNIKNAPGRGPCGLALSVHTTDITQDALVVTDWSYQGEQPIVPLPGIRVTGGQRGAVAFR